MNQLKLDNTGGFPMDTNVLAFMQTAYSLFNSLGNLAGNLSIIQGCEATGTSVSDGVVYIKGEVLPFRGGTASSNVVIKQEIKTLPFEDGQPKPVEKIRYATFGAGSPFYKWTDFKRLDNLQKLKADKEDKTTVTTLTKRLETLEKRLTKTIPLGLVALWDRPANEIPEGWVEHTEMRGRVPAGQNPSDSDFATLGRNFGEKEHTLTESNLPKIRPRWKNYYGVKIDSYDGRDNLVYASAFYHSKNKAMIDRYPLEEIGRNTPNAISIVQPTRIVKYIRFVGFE